MSEIKLTNSIFFGSTLTNSIFLDDCLLYLYIL